MENRSAWGLCRAWGIFAPALLCLSLGAQNDSRAQAFPTRPITVIYPYAGGSTTEAGARSISAEAAKILGQPVVFENRPGANGRLGLKDLIAARGDAHTLFWGSDGLMVIQPIADPDFKLEVGKDYVPISLGIQLYLTLVGRAGLPYRDAKGMIAYAKANPGKINFAHGGTGSSGHFVSEMLLQSADITATLIPYKGATPALNDLIGGQVDLLFLSASSRPFIDSGKAIGIASAAKTRIKPFLDIPTFLESGINVSPSIWFGVIAPGGTAPDVVAKLNAAFNGAQKNPELARRLEANGYITNVGMSAADFASFIRSEVDASTPVVRKTGFRLQ